MIPYQFEIVTAITTILIGAILTVYLFLLKKNGWIGKNFDRTTANPNSEKPLQKPGENKNFLCTKGNEIVRSKPELAVDILSGKRPLGEVALQSKIELKTRYSTSKITGNKIFTTNNYNKEHKMDKTAIPDVESRENDDFQKMTHESFIKQKTINTKKEAPEGCNNFLGYLRARHKSTPLPDECFTCRRLIDCVKETKE